MTSKRRKQSSFKKTTNHTLNIIIMQLKIAIKNLQPSLIHTSSTSGLPQKNWLMKANLFLLSSLILTTLLVSCSHEKSDIETEIKVPVSVISIKPQSISSFIETTGTVYSSKEGTMKSQLSGNYRLLINPATKKPYALGDQVKQGQILVRIEDKEFVNNLQLDSKRLNLELSENNLKKQKSLYDKGGVTQTEMKTASMEYVNAKYSFENAEIQMAKMGIKAPFDGVIVELPYHTDGVKIDQGVDLFKVMEYNKLLMDVKLPEKHLADIRLNQLVEITNYNIANDTIKGSISQISPVVDADSRTFRSVLQIENTKHLLRPGMFIKAAILSEKRDSTIVIPKETIISRQDGKVVFTVENGIATEKKITTGLENMDDIEVVNGLKINDRLVVTGFETLRNKSKVSIIQ